MRKSILALAAAVAIAVVGGATGSQAEVVLKGVSAFPKGNDLSNDFQRFVDMVNERGKGVISIDFIGGPEVMPPQEQGPALGKGLFDILFGPPTYYTGVFPEAEVFSGPLLPSADIRKGGGVEIYDQALGERLNSKVLAFAGGNVGLYIFTSKKPEISPSGLPDLSGMTLRSSPLYAGLFQEMGAKTVVLPGNEVYTALERGLADGLGWNLMGVKQSGWDKFLKYRIDPAMYVSSLVVTINLDKYNSLPDDAKKVLNDVSLQYEQDLEAYYKDRQEAEKAVLKDVGIETIELTPEQAAVYQKAAMDTMWSRVVANDKIKIDLDKARSIFYGK